MKMTAEQIAHSERARALALKTIKPGDRLYIERCGGIRCTVTMTGWDGYWITSKTLDDISAIHILRVNGKPMSFREMTALCN